MNSDQFEQLAAAIHSRQAVTGELHIDLSAVSYISLAAVTKLIALMHTAEPTAHRSSRVSFIPPRSPQVMYFLHKIRLFTLIAGAELFPGANELAHAEERSRLGSQEYPFMPFRRFFATNVQSAAHDFRTSMNEFIGHINTTFREVLTETFNYDVDDTSDFARLNFEVYQNIYYHSRSWGYAAIQTDQAGVLICYGDVGLGFKRTLTPQSKDITQVLRATWSDSTAIRGAFRRGITSKAGTGYGLGLAKVLRFVQRKGGTIECRSGAGRVVFRGSRSKVQDELVPIPGVQLVIHLPRSRRA